MLTLEIAANIAEIIAGLAIAGAAIRAWPIFRGMETRLSEQKRSGKLIKQDVRRFQEALRQQFDIDSSASDAVELLTLFLGALPGQRGSDLYFEYFPSKGELPGVLTYQIYEPQEPGAKRVLLELSRDGYGYFMDALNTLSRADTDASAKAYIELPPHRFLVHFSHSVSSPVASVRLAPQHILTVEQLGVDKLYWWPRVSKLLSAHDPSLVICSGPIGSGKSTTAASLVEFVNRDKNSRVVTMELPVDFVHPGATQLSCNTEDELEALFPNVRGLNPDVFFIACRGAGRFVWESYGDYRLLASLSANDATAMLESLCQEGREFVRSIDAPFVILSQVLSQGLCQQCAEPATLSADDEAFITSIRQRHVAAMKEMNIGDRFMEAAGCELCGTSLFRIASMEMLEVTQDILALVPNGTKAIRKKAIEDGMVSLELNALEQASKGLIAFSDFKAIASRFSE